MGRTARKYPTGRFILRTPAKVDAEKLYPIYIYYFCDGKQLRQSTSFMAKVKDWNAKANHGIGELRASHGAGYRKKNATLQKMLMAIDANILNYVEHYGTITADIVKGFMCGDTTSLRADKGLTFEAYAMDLLEKQYTQRKIRVSTYKNSITIMNQFKAFIADSESYTLDKLFVGSMSEDIVRDFLSWGDYARSKD